ncbi:unnamed protein product [Laminaria digitata]
MCCSSRTWLWHIPRVVLAKCCLTVLLSQYEVPGMLFLSLYLLDFCNLPGVFDLFVSCLFGQKEGLIAGALLNEAVLAKCYLIALLSQYEVCCFCPFYLLDFCDLRVVCLISLRLVCLDRRRASSRTHC